MTVFDESDYERASKLAQGEIDASIARHRAEIAARGAGRHQCAECGEPISSRRRIEFRADLCVECQGIKEQRDRLRG